MEINKRKLKSGANLYLFPVDGVKTFTLAFVFDKAGSSYDPVGKSGLHTLLAGVVQRGTKKYKNYQDLNFELETMGGQLSVGIDDEQISFGVHAPEGTVGKAVEIISEVLLNPLFDNREIEKEKVNQVSEIIAEKNDPQSYTGVEFGKMIYEGTGFEFNALGDETSVMSLQRADLRDLLSWILNRQLHILCIGKFDEAEVIEQIEKCFGNQKFGQGGIQKYKEFDFKKFAKKKKLKIMKNDLDQTVVYLGTYTSGASSRDYYKSVLTSTIFGSGFGCMVIDEIREKRHLAYYASGRFDRKANMGVMYTYSGIQETNLLKVVELAKRQFYRFKDGDFSQEDIDRAKNYFLGTILISTESLSSKAGYYAAQILYRDTVLSYDEISKLIKSLTKEDIIEFANTNIEDDFYLCINGAKNVDEKALMKVLGD